MAAVINLKVKSDFKQAGADLKKFGNISEAEAKKIQKYQEAFKSDQVDKFIDRSRRAGAAVKATSGNVRALAVQQRMLTREMERLIKAGIDPESEAVEDLRKEYDRLEKEVQENIKSQKKMELTTKGTAMATKAAALGLAAIASGVVASTGIFIKLASSVEMVEASFTPLLGSTAKAKDLVEQLNKTAATTPFQFQDIANAATQLLPAMNGNLEETVKTFRMLGDTAGGSAEKLNAVSAIYSRAILKNKVETGDLNILTGKGIPIYKELAESMGISVAEMAKLASQGKITGEDLTNVFQKMTSEGGIFFEGMTIASQTAEGKLSTIADVFKFIGVQIGNQFLPKWKMFLDVVINSGNKISMFISQGDNLKKSLEIITLTLAGLTAGLITFLLITKGAAALQVMATAFRALNLAMAANPVALIATVIVAVLIPAIILLVKNWDFVVVIITTTLQKLLEKFKLFGNAIATNWIKAINGIKVLFLSLAGIILEKVLGAVNKFLDVAQKLPFVGEKFAGLQENVNSFAAELDNARLEAIKEAEDSTAAAEERRAALKIQTAANIAEIEREKQARLAAIEAQKKANEEAQREAETGGSGGDSVFVGVGAYEESLRTAQFAHAKFTEVIKSQTNAMLEFLKDNWMAYSESVVSGFTNLLGAIDQLNQVRLQNDLASIDERMNAELASKDLLLETEKERLEKELQAAFAAGDLTKIKEKQDALDRLKIVEKFEKEKANAEYKAALASWRLQLASAIASAAVAIAKTLSSVPFPFNIPLALLQGAASAVQISATAQAKPKPPAFREGGQFTTSGAQDITVGDNEGGREKVTIEPVSSDGLNVENGIGGAGRTPVYLILDTGESLSGYITNQARDGNIQIDERAVVAS